MPHKSRLAGFIIDCNVDDLDAAARFWSGALGMVIENPDAGDGTAEYQQFGDSRMPISLTFDHRACTGGEAARFLKALLDDLSAPQ